MRGCVFRLTHKILIGSLLGEKCTISITNFLFADDPCLCRLNGRPRDRADYATINREYPTLTNAAHSAFQPYECFECLLCEHGS